MNEAIRSWGVGSGPERTQPSSCPSPKPQAPFPCGGRVTRHASRVTSKGFSLVSALFLIVVVGALGAFAMRIGSSQQQTVNIALLSARALAAAESGIEWGAFRALNAGSCANATLNLTEAGLNGFSVAVTCTSSPHTEAGVSINVYRIEAFAQAGTYGTPDFVSRRVYATFTSTP